MNAVGPSRALAALALALLVACAGPRQAAAPERPDPAAQAAASALAPTGTLRIGVYLVSPTSLVRDAGGQAHGVAVDLGRALAQQLGVPSRLVEYPRLVAVLDALKAGDVDFTVTNASPARAGQMRFGPPLLTLELGYLVLPGGRVKSLADVDQAGVRVGVTLGSSSQAALPQRLTQASVVAAPTLQAAAQMLARGELDAFATNKAILHEMADGLPGAIVLPGRWGEEHLAIAIPIAHEAGLAEVARFAAAARADGRVQRAAERAGLRGMLGAQ